MAIMRPQAGPDGPAPTLTGLAVAAAAVALCTGLLFPLREVAPVVSLGVVYLLAVLLVASGYGLRLGAVTAAGSAVAFNLFHLPPTGRLTIASSGNAVGLAAFLVAALAAARIADLARRRARDAEERRREADLSAELARVLLGADSLEVALPTAARRLAQALGLPSAALELERVEPGDRATPFVLRDGDALLGTLVVPAGLDERLLRRLQERVVPALEALLAAAVERRALQGDVVETAALRQGDVVKTALLRSVSHDLRSPLTAITTAGEAFASPTLTAADREELASVVVEEAGRLTRLVDDLLDLSRLEAGAAVAQREWIALEDVLAAAIEDVHAVPGAVRLVVDPELPLLRADAAQLERALSNVIRNALRHAGGGAGGHPVSVRARASNGRMLIRVVDRGPGIPPAQLERVFEPFFSAGGERTGGTRGSGLGLAIARGFVEAGGGRLTVESLPGQGASFVFELPLEPASAPAAAPMASPSRATSTP